MDYSYDVSVAFSEQFYSFVDLQKRLQNFTSSSILHRGMRCSGTRAGGRHRKMDRCGTQEHILLHGSRSGPPPSPIPMLCAFPEGSPVHGEVGLVMVLSFHPS